MITLAAAEQIVLAAVSEVRDPAVAQSLRADSPLLSSVQLAALTAADAVALADAVGRQAVSQGARCVLTDADLAFVDPPTLTVAQVAASVQVRWVANPADEAFAREMS